MALDPGNIVVVFEEMEGKVLGQIVLYTKKRGKDLPVIVQDVLRENRDSVCLDAPLLVSALWRLLENGKQYFLLGTRLFKGGHQLL